MWLLKVEDEDTSSEYGKRPEERSIEEAINNSIVIVDKHSGPTSHQVTGWLKEMFGVKKAGHAGTLDPKVTGVLPIALGNAVKAISVLMGLDKEYVGIMHLHRDVDVEMLRRSIAKKFVGEIIQVPPKRAAVARKPRKRKVYFFDILEKEGKDVLFHVRCEAGTYIRKLVWDLGKALGIGAHMTELRRIRVGNFQEEQAHSLVRIRDAYEIWKESGEEKLLRKILIPVEHAILHVKRIFVKDSAIHNIANGAPVYISGIVRIQKGIVPGETIAIFSLKNELVALGIAKLTSEEMFKRKRGIAVRTDRVFISRDVYPKMK